MPRPRNDRTPWVKTTWQESERYTVDGLPGSYEDPVEAIRAAEARHTLARRVSDGRALNSYAWDERFA